MESFGNPRRFAQIARRVGRDKPIVALKAGRSCSGARAASSHTGALAASDDVVDALFRDAGVIRTGTVEEMFETAALLAHQPLPAGPRVAVLTNAGGPGILAADACEAHGLTLGTLAPTTRDALRAFLPAAAGLSNPIDMIATASASDYRRAIPLLLQDPGIDSLLTIFIPPIVTRAQDVAAAIAETTRGAGKPVLATFFGASGVPDILAPVPCYAFPESAARALAHAVKYAQWRSAPAGQVPAMQNFDHGLGPADLWRVRGSPPMDGSSPWPSPLDWNPAAFTPLPHGSSSTRRERWPRPINSGSRSCSKAWVRPCCTRREAHAVFTGLRSVEDVLRAYHALARRPDVKNVLVQPMVKDGVEMFVGATLDPTFGHIVMCGSGGTMVELLHDTSCRLAPITDRAAREMIDETRGSALLRGFRGSQPADEAAFRDVLLRTSALVNACPEIAELDLNPVIVTRGRRSRGGCADSRRGGARFVARRRVNSISRSRRRARGTPLSPARLRGTGRPSTHLPADG